jgi:hypothetical protein
MKRLYLRRVKISSIVLFEGIIGNDSTNTSLRVNLEISLHNNLEVYEDSVTRPKIWVFEFSDDKDFI